MINDPFEMISAAQREAARSAIETCFGSATVDAIMPILGGASGAFVFRIDARRRRYILRIEGDPSPLRNPQQYVSIRIAADAGIAPRIHYLDANARIVVMDFVQDQRLETYPGGPHGLAQAMGAMLRQVQALPIFPYFVNYPDIVDRLWAHVRRTGLFADGVLDPASERLARIRESLVWNQDNAVASHNDVLPRNMLFDGNRLWLIDWETAYRNDPLVDVATALDNFAPSLELEEVLLEAWLGHSPDQSRRERLALIRALTRVYYAGVLFSASATAQRERPHTDLAAMTHADFERAIRTRRLKPETPPTSHELGKMYLASFLSDQPPPGLPPLYMR